MMTKSGKTMASIQGKHNEEKKAQDNRTLIDNEIVEVADIELGMLD